MKSESQTPYRVAVYFAPEADSVWWHAGSQWLGRCAETLAELDQPDVLGIDRALMHQLTAEPRRYGWHATLKAPFQLLPGQTIDSLVESMSGFLSHAPSFVMPALQVSSMGSFLALRPSGDVAPIHSLAADCVTQLHALATPLGDAELNKRRQVQLSPQQDEMLLRWGYPWVLDHFRFHFSLSGDWGRVSQALRESLIRAAERHFHALPACRFESVAVFMEPRKGDPFQLVRRVRLRT